MSAAPQLPEVLLEFGRTLAIATSSMIIAFIVVGAAAYLCLCRASCRRWNGVDRRWERPLAARKQSVAG